MAKWQQSATYGDPYMPKGKLVGPVGVYGQQKTGISASRPINANGGVVGYGSTGMQLQKDPTTGQYKYVDSRPSAAAGQYSQLQSTYGNSPLMMRAINQNAKNELNRSVSSGTYNAGDYLSTNNRINGTSTTPQQAAQWQAGSPSGYGASVPKITMPQIGSTSIGGTANGSGGSGGFANNDIVKAYQDAQDKANSANEERYQQGLGMFDKMIANYSTSTYGQGVRDQISQKQKQDTAAGMQQLVNSGLFNSTIAPSVAQSASESAMRSTNQLNDMITGNINNVMGQKAQFIANRNDVAPDPSGMMGIMQTLGSGGYGSMPYSPMSATSQATPGAAVRVVASNPNKYMSATPEQKNMLLREPTQSDRN